MSARLVQLGVLMKGIKVITAFLLIVSAFFSIRLALAMETDEEANLALGIDEEADMVGKAARRSIVDEAERKKRVQQKEELALAKAIIESKSTEESVVLRNYLNSLRNENLKTYARTQLEKIQNDIGAYRNLTGFAKSFVPLEKRTQYALDELAQKEIALAKQKEAALAQQAALAKEKTKVVEQSIHIISPKVVEETGLWPLYPNGYTAEIAPGETYTLNSPRTYHDIKTFKTIVEDDPSDKLPGYRELSAADLNIPADNKKRHLMQLKTFNQEVFENANSLCWALAVRNTLLLSSFVYTGDTNFLKQLPSIDGVKSFLDYYKLNELVAKLGAQSMFTKEQVEDFMQKNFTQPSAFVIDPSLIKDRKITVMATPFEIDKTNWFVEEESSASNAAKRVREGLKQKEFFHAFILGEDELAAISGDTKAAGHYITFAVVKKSNNIVYVVADTKADHYYIGPDNSYEYQKLLHFIESLEKGKSTRLSLDALRAVVGKN